MTSTCRLVVFDWEGTLGDSLEQKMIPGSRLFLERLNQSGIKLAIATNKRDSSLQKDLQYFELMDLFEVTRSANQTALKPDPRMLEEILLATETPCVNALMIGDSESDMAMAKAVNVEAIGIDLSGHYEASLRLAGASKVFRDYDTLMAFFFQENNK
jgi:phosphoglycolate phosphatase